MILKLDVSVPLWQFNCSSYDINTKHKGGVKSIIPLNNLSWGPDGRKGWCWMLIRFFSLFKLHQRGDLLQVLLLKVSLQNISKMSSGSSDRLRAIQRKLFYNGTEPSSSFKTSWCKMQKRFIFNPKENVLHCSYSKINFPYDFDV